jgi:hypothetical protein
MSCDKCNDTGKIVHDFVNETGGVTGFWTELCTCRRDLPRRYGRAAWWSMDDAISDTHETCAGYVTMTLWSAPELPVSEDNYPLHRTTENSYFRPGVSIQMEGEDVLTTDDLRALANFMLAFADRVDKRDGPIPDEAVQA